MDIIKILEEVKFIMRDYGFDEEEEKLRAVINTLEESEDNHLFTAKTVEDGKWVTGYLVEGEHSYIITKKQFYNAVVTLSGNMSTSCHIIDKDTIRKL